MTRTADVAARIYGTNLAARRLKFALGTSTRIDGITSAEMVAFCPMEAVGERGDLDMSQRRAYEDVASGYTRFANGDVLVAKITPCFENGKGALVQGLSPNLGFGTTELHVLTPGEELEGRFLYYVSMSSSFRKLGEEQMTGAAGQKRVPTEFIRDYPIWIPPVEYQQRIADYLDAQTAEIDALISEKERMLGLLEEKRAAVITHAVTRGLDPQAKLKPSGLDWLGGVPEHWRIERLKFYLSQGIEQGWSPVCENQPAEVGEWAVLKVGCVNGALFNPDEHKALPADIAPEMRYEIQEDDILLSRGNTLELVGSASVVPRVRTKLLLSDLLYRCRIDINCLNPCRSIGGSRREQAIRPMSMAGTVQHTSGKKYFAATVSSTFWPGSCTCRLRNGGLTMAGRCGRNR